MPESAIKSASVLLVDDHPLMRKGLRTLLEAEPDLVVAGEANNGEQAVEQARALSPDIVVMDISMPALNGIDASWRRLRPSPVHSLGKALR